MKHLYRVAQGINVSSLMLAIQRHPELWNADKFRTTFPQSPHAQVDDILIRFSDTSKCTTTTQVMGDESNIWHPAASVLHEVKPFILGVMQQVGAYELGRVIISRLPPGGAIARHPDKVGDYVQAKDRARLHLVLQGNPGSLYMVGEEVVCMRTGELWWFNAHEEHEVKNNSDDDRVHLMIDVRTIWS